MKFKYNIVGNEFRHTSGGNKGYSIHGQISNYIEWTSNPDVDTFYINNNIINSRLNSNVLNYGWICEPRSVVPNVYNYIENNQNIILNKFKYIFTFDEKLLSLNSNFKFIPAGCPWIKDIKIHTKTKLCSFIASNKNKTFGHKKRHEWYHKLKNDVDVFGKIANRHIPNKETALNDYMFSIVIENDMHNHLYTEKILDCFSTGTIPIYMGCESIGNFFDINGIILLDSNFDIKDLNIDLYNSKLNSVKINYDKSIKYQTIEDFIYLHYLKDL